MPIKVKGYRKGSTYVKTHTRRVARTPTAKREVDKISSAYNKVAKRLTHPRLTKHRKTQLSKLSDRLAQLGVERFYRN